MSRIGDATRQQETDVCLLPSWEFSVATCPAPLILNPSVVN